MHSKGNHKRKDDWEKIFTNDATDKGLISRIYKQQGFPYSSVGKKICLQCRRPGFNSWAGKIPWRRKWPLQYSCLENPIDRGAWQATVHGVTRVGHDLVTKPPPPWWLTVRASIPKQVDKKSKGPRGGGERGVGLWRKRKGSEILKEEERTNVFFYIP